MNVIWKEKCLKGENEAEVELIFTPADVVADINQPIVISISVFPMRKNSGVSE